ncbi:DUF4197 domain-containing protein [soil metagenome]
MKHLKFAGFSLVLLVLVSLSVDTFAQTKRRRTARKTTTTSTVSNTEINDGLKAALFQGVENAVKSLGRENGFLDNVRVKIPLPGALQKTEKTLRFLGQGEKVDEFVESMNHAAEEAVPVATDIFLDSVKQMTFTDAKNILLSKQDDAATQFFRRTSENRLKEELRPIVEDFTEKVGVTQKYKEMVGRYGFLGQALGQDAGDIDGYVTQKALDGLFLLMADEEKKIRKDPIGRTTDLLRKVFGGIFK